MGQLHRYPSNTRQYKGGPSVFIQQIVVGESVDLTTLDFFRIAIGVVILLYVANCLLNQKVWIRKTFSWGTKEEYPKIFQMNIIGGTLIGLFLVASPFLW